MERDRQASQGMARRTAKFTDQYGHDAPGNPVFFCGLSEVQVIDNLGRGDRISGTIYVTNDDTIKRSVVTPFFSPLIGQVEYEACLSAPLLAYSHRAMPKIGDEQNILRGHLLSISAFETTSWLTRDHSIGHRGGWLWANERIWSNALDGKLWNSRGDQTPLNLSRHEFRQLRKSTFNWTIDPTTSDDIKHTVVRESSTRSVRAMHQVFYAQRTPSCVDKIAHYCSALEALVATGHGELVHQLAERAAILVAESCEERLSTYRFIKKCYSLRSQHLHGAAVRQKDMTEIADSSNRLDEIVRRAVNRTLDDGDLATAMDAEDKLDDWFLKVLFK